MLLRGVKNCTFYLTYTSRSHSAYTRLRRQEQTS